MNGQKGYKKKNGKRRKQTQSQTVHREKKLSGKKDVDKKTRGTKKKVGREWRDHQ